MRGLLQALMCALCLSVAPLLAVAQQPSATPVPAILVRATPQSRAEAETTATVPPIETALPSARLEALASAGEVNVRALPDVESELLGVISHGTAYPALRVYYRWYEFRYDLSPTGRAWVYGDLVTLDGDASQLEVIEDYAEILGNARSVALEDRAIQVATLDPVADRNAALASSPLPTFTPPAATQAPFGDQIRIADAGDARSDQLPPLAPILALGGLGVIGMFISLLRR